MARIKRIQKKRCAIIFLGCASFFFLGTPLMYAQTEEKLSIVTYYPSPFGSYRELTWGNATNTCGELNDSEGASLNLGSSAATRHPWIGFSSGTCSPAKALIQLTDDRTLTISGSAANFRVSIIGGLDVASCVNYTNGAPDDSCPTGYYAVACGVGSCGGTGYIVSDVLYDGSYHFDWGYRCPPTGHMICIRHG